MRSSHLRTSAYLFLLLLVEIALRLDQLEEAAAQRARLSIDRQHADSAVDQLSLRAQFGGLLNTTCVDHLACGFGRWERGGED